MNLVNTMPTVMGGGGVGAGVVIPPTEDEVIHNLTQMYAQHRWHIVGQCVAGLNLRPTLLIKNFFLSSIHVSPLNANC